MVNRIKILNYLYENDMPQYRFAQKLNITETHLSKVLRGRVKPSKDLIIKLYKIIQGGS